MHRSNQLRHIFTIVLAFATLFAGACGGGGSSQSAAGLLPVPPAGGHNHGLPTPTPTPTSVGATPTPTPTPVQTSANVAAHVQDYTFWQYDGSATNVPASYMAAWATWVETSGSSYANAFHAAGGKYAVAYTDPNYYYVGPGYTAPGNYPETAFGHGSDGTRTQRPEGGGTEYYLNPASAGSQSGYLGIVNAIAASGGFNYIYADGVSDSLATSLYRMSPTPVEITTNAAYVAGMQALMALSPLPMIINGYNNGSPLTVEQEFVGSSNIAAPFGEGCFAYRTSLLTDTPYQHKWSDMANALLATTSRGYPAICGGRGDLADNRALRMYYVASWWLTYDPNYSVSLELMTSSSNVYLFPEQLIVPTNPVQSPGSSISSLQSSTGAYVRQFGACYYDKVAWGSCAAIVNPSYDNTVNMPAVAANYHHALVLDNNNLFDGGQATLSNSVPASLAPGTAIVLFQ